MPQGREDRPLKPVRGHDVMGACGHVSVPWWSPPPSFPFVPRGLTPFTPPHKARLFRVADVVMAVVSQRRGP